MSNDLENHLHQRNLFKNDHLKLVRGVVRLFLFTHSILVRNPNELLLYFLRLEHESDEDKSHVLWW